MIRFGVLGPLDVRVEDRAVDLGGARQRSLLAALLLHAGEPVPADALAQMLWGDEAPPTAAKALQVSVSRLRGALGDASDRLETAAGGYRLRVEPGELDADRFERAYDRARSLPTRDAVRVLRDALDLWRGPALVDVRYEPWAQGEIRRLDELHGAAIEARVEAELALGEHARLVGELEALVADHPHREHLRALQMLALYRSGRHADALAAYRAARETLDAELGLEPGPELRELEQAILTHDPALASRPGAQTGIPAPPPTPTFGRAGDVRAVLDALASARLVTLVGPGGVGKTRLGVEVARAGDGRFVSLAATTAADRIATAICDALAIGRIPGETDDDAVDRALGRGPLLLVLDNLEQIPDAGPLLGGLLERHPELTLLATSRRPLEIHAERQFPVAPLAVGEASPAAALFADRARARDPSFTLTEDNAPAVAAICERLAGLPLAIELAAARLGVLTPTILADRLEHALAVLDHGLRDAPERQQTLRATLDWSYELLDESERDAFTALGAFTGGCELDAAEAVTGHPVPVLDGLVRQSLVVARDGRLTLLEPVRQYAAERLAERVDAEAVRARHFAHFLALAERTEFDIWVRGRSAPAFPAVHRERHNLEAAITWAFASGTPVDALALAGALGSYGWYGRIDKQVSDWCARAFDAAGDDAPLPVRARALRTLLGVTFDERAVERAQATVALYRRLEPDAGIVIALLNLARVHDFRAEYGVGRQVAEEALEHARQLGEPGLIGPALAELALAIPDIEKAIPVAREAVVQLRAVGAIGRIAAFLSTLAMAALSEDAYDRAEELAREALAPALELGDLSQLPQVHGNAGLAALLAGRLDAARGAFTAELEAARADGQVTYYHEGLLGLAALAAADGEDHRAATLEAAAWALSDRPPYPTEMPVYDRIEARFIAAARQRLGTNAWDTAAAAGRAMTPDEALAFGLQPPVSAGRLAP